MRFGMKTQIVLFSVQLDPDNQEIQIKEKPAYKNVSYFQSYSYVKVQIRIIENQIQGHILSLANMLFYPVWTLYPIENIFTFVLERTED